MNRLSFIKRSIAGLFGTAIIPRLELEEDWDSYTLEEFVEKAAMDDWTSKEFSYIPERGYNVYKSYVDNDSIAYIFTGAGGCLVLEDSPYAASNSFNINKIEDRHPNLPGTNFSISSYDYHIFIPENKTYIKVYVNYEWIRDQWGWTTTI